MIKNTKITLSKKDAQIMVRLLDMARRETTKNKEDRSDSFRWVEEEAVKRFGDFSYLFNASDVSQIIITSTSSDEH
jgi:hypothetical protein